MCSYNTKLSRDHRAVSVDCSLLACMHNTLLSNYRALALLAQETTKSHRYLDYIMGPPTHAACMPQILFTAARLSSRYTVSLSGSLPKGVQVYDAGLAKDRKHACLRFPSSTGGQTSYWQWLRWGGERAASRCSCTCRYSNTPAVARTGAAK